jgi:hypothetical protein
VRRTRGPQDRTSKVFGGAGTFAAGCCPSPRTPRAAGPCRGACARLVSYCAPPGVELAGGCRPPSVSALHSPLFPPLIPQCSFDVAAGLSDPASCSQSAQQASQRAGPRLSGSDNPYVCSTLSHYLRSCSSQISVLPGAELVQPMGHRVRGHVFTSPSRRSSSLLALHSSSPRHSHPHRACAGSCRRRLTRDTCCALRVGSTDRRCPCPGAARPCAARRPPQRRGLRALRRARERRARRPSQTRLPRGQWAARAARAANFAKTARQAPRRWAELLNGGRPILHERLGFRPHTAR